MLNDKELKVKYRIEFKKNPKYYPVKALNELGFFRNKCNKCKKFFWAQDKKRSVCGDSACIGGFSFIHNPLAKIKLDYLKTWKRFVQIFKKQGYTPINRYPVTARWREDISFVEASIDDFIPYVINGEVQPPVNPLIVPQFCLRFNDIDNVGITGAHNTGFIMIGQHRFEKTANYDPNQYLLHLFKWFTNGLKINPYDIVFHEDVWAGSGNFGPCIEIFSGGLELANQVYMQFKQTATGYEDLKLKVLDMGLGYERNVWFSQGAANSYETTFPTVVKKLKKITGLRPDENILKQFLPFSGLLNIDEIDNAEKIWKDISKKIGINENKLKASILPLSALYSIAEHSRTLLVALSDSALPSNVGGGYNLRVILRRALSFIEKYEWNIYLPDLINIHAKYLKPLFPELSNNLDKIKEILDIEKEKYKQTRKTSKSLVVKFLQNKYDVAALLKMYDSHGVTPEIVKEEAEKLGKKIEIPENFYAQVSELHKKKEKKIEKKHENLDITGLPETKILFYDNPKLTEFKAKILKVINKKYVVLDKTLFYPESGGQAADKGTINGLRVYDVQKINNIVLHAVEKPKFKKGAVVKGKIDWNIRKQLMQHHTAIHIINAAARSVLGNHIWQAGAKKTEKKAHLDITHYKSLSDKEVEKIESVANDFINRKIKIEKMILSRTEAEKRFGMRIYQGGAVPGKTIRIVNIPNIDVEACAGTHLDNTSEVEKIIIIGTERIQDGIDRITIKAGSAAIDYLEENFKKVKEILEFGKQTSILKVSETALKLKPEQALKQMQACARLFNISINKIKPTLEKFYVEIKKNNEEIERIVAALKIKPVELKSISCDNIEDICKHIFDLWKLQNKYIKKLRKQAADSKIKPLLEKAKKNSIYEIVHGARKELIEIASKLTEINPKLTVVLANEAGEIVGMSKKQDVAKIVKELCEKAGGSGGGKPNFAQGKAELSKLLKFGFFK